MPTITHVGNTSNSHTSPGLLWDEFLPIVNHRNPTKEEYDDGSIFLDADVGEKVTLSKYLDNNENKNIQGVETEVKTFKIHFTVKQGSDTYFKDEDGYIEPKITVKNDAGDIVEYTEADIKITEITVTDKSKNKTKKIDGKKIFTKYDDDLSVEINITAKETKEFYLDFYANDNEDTFKGDLKNIFCGRVKISFKTLNQWQFTKDKIDLIKVYAKENYANVNKQGDKNRYHHCTDTHKHIILKLLDSPNELNLGKDQDHEAIRNTPNDFIKAGEATTKGVRDISISTTYAEPSKTFTVIDINGKEVLNSDGTAGNTNTYLDDFKETPIEYMKSKCPDNGYYVFIGAYNADFHSFTIIIKKDNDNFTFEFVDQIVGIKSTTTEQLKNRFLNAIYRWKSNFPMQLELYQLRNKKK